MHKLLCLVLVFLTGIAPQGLAQDDHGTLKRRGEQSAEPQATATPDPQASTLPPDVSGMYSFPEQDGYIHISIVDGELDGLLSVAGESESDKGDIIDLPFEKTRLSGHTLEFSTRHVHETWFEFAGTIIRGKVKMRAEEGYYLMQGRLIQKVLGPDGKLKTKMHNIRLKSAAILSE